MKNGIGFALLCSTAILVAPAVQAQQAPANDYDIASQDLGSAINQLALTSGRQIVVADDLVRGRRAPALRGRYSAEAALSVLLEGSSLRAVAVGNTLVVQRSDAPAQEDSGQVILVTGSRIRGHGPVGSPVITIDREAIDQNGFATTQQIVQSIPQNFAGGANEIGGGLINSAGSGNSGLGSGVNLRGLGQTSTLLLINGDRPPLGGFGGSFGDLSTIPASIIQRIEILPDGASAIYGSDAVAGVVNVITRRDFTGSETSARFGSADGDSQEYQFSQLFGTGWSSGNLVVSYEFYKRDRLRAADRDFVSEDLRPFGGPDRRGNHGNPGTIFAGGRSFAIPAGQNGRGLTAAQLVPGTVNLSDRWFEVDVLPEQRRHSIFAAFSQDLTPAIRFYATGLATWRNFDQAQQSTTETRRAVPITNPFYVDPIGTGQPIGVNYSFVRDLGPERLHGQVQAYGGSAGLEGRFGGWTVDLHGTWGRQDEGYTYLNIVNSARLALALADTNPSTAYNLLGDGSWTNPATIDSIRGYNKRDYGGLSWSTTLRADGPLLSLPAGELRIAIGAEYRKDRYRDGPTLSYTSTLSPVVLAATPLPGGRSIRSAYAELLIPVFGESAQIPGFRRLDFSAALRSESYSDFGTTRNPKVSFAWESLPGITVRGSYGTSFRAPLFTELRQDRGSIAYFAYPAADPQSPTGTSNLLVIRGNDPNLRPERATTWTIGTDIKPKLLPGFRLGVTYFNVRYRDRIATPAPNIPNFLINRSVYASILTPNPSQTRINEVYASPYYRDFFGIPATAVFAAEADARLQNLSVVDQSGLDLDFAYGFDAGGGRLEFGAAGTYIFHIRQALTPTATPVDVLDAVGNPIDLRFRGHGTWSLDRFGAALFVNYADGYRNRTTAVTQRVGSWTTFDLNLSYRFSPTDGPLAGVRIALNGTNIFDQDPPFTTYLAGTFTTGYDGENASPLGRVISLQVSRQW